MKTLSNKNGNTEISRTERFFKACRHVFSASLSREAQALLENHRNRSQDYPFDFNRTMVGSWNGQWKC